MPRSPTPTVPTGAALYIAAVQGLFVTTWTVYVIFLPQLLATAGLPAGWLPWILLVDQAVFTVADVATGVAADRVQRALGRLGPWIVGATALSCLAFLLLPHTVRLGGAASAVTFGLMGVWTVTSSALRAPPWVLLGRYAARPALPWLNALTLVGLALGGAIAPFLGVALKGLDPRLPFALSSLTLLATTAGLVYVERRLARGPVAVVVPARRPPLGDARHATWMLAILLLAAAFQTHFAINTAAQYGRFAAPAALEWLVPLFWVGFGAATVPGSALSKRHGPLPVTAAAALLGMTAALAADHAGALPTLVAAQLVAGAAWGVMLMAIYVSAVELGRSGREGLALGTMFAMFALATIVRIGMVLAGWPRDAALAPLLGGLPALLWGAGGLLLAGLVLAGPSARQTVH